MLLWIEVDRRDYVASKHKQRSCLLFAVELRSINTRQAPRDPYEPPYFIGLSESEGGYRNYKALQRPYTRRTKLKSDVE